MVSYEDLVFTYLQYSNEVQVLELLNISCPRPLISKVGPKLFLILNGPRDMFISEYFVLF